MFSGREHAESWGRAGPSWLGSGGPHSHTYNWGREKKPLSCAHNVFVKSQAAPPPGAVHHYRGRTLGWHHRCLTHQAIHHTHRPHPARKPTSDQCVTHSNFTPTDRRRLHTACTWLKPVKINQSTSWLGFKWCACPKWETKLCAEATMCGAVWSRVFILQWPRHTMWDLVHQTTPVITIVVQFCGWSHSSISKAFDTDAWWALWCRSHSLWINDPSQFTNRMHCKLVIKTKPHTAVLASSIQPTTMHVFDSSHPVHVWMYTLT